MIPPKGDWHIFSSSGEKLEFMIDSGLLPPTTKYTKDLIYSGGYTKDLVNCTLRGYVKSYISVIGIDGELHCINTDYLADMQAGRSSALIPETYVVIDFETTGCNHKTDRITEVGAVKYAHGIEVDVFETLVNPQMPIPFDVSALTGIYNDDVAGKPTFEEILPDLTRFIGAAPIIAHNAPFEKSFLDDAYRAAGTQFKNDVIDTLKLARKAFPSLESHKLEYLKTALGLTDQRSHRALADVYTCAELYIRCIEQLRNVQSEKPDPSDEKHTSEKNTPRKQAGKKGIIRHKSPKEIKPTVDKFDENHPLYKKSIVFTGEMETSREDAMQQAVNCGAVVSSSVSGRTNYLVVGRQDEALVGAEGLSTKERKAGELNKNGRANIILLNEEDFLHLIHNEVLA